MKIHQSNKQNYVINVIDGCSYCSYRGDIQRMLLASDQRRVRYVPIDVVEALERECKEAGGLQPEIQGGLAFIYPGTKW